MRTFLSGRDADISTWVYTRATSQNAAREACRLFRGAEKLILAAAALP
jgi:hypothetical protein